MSAHGRAAHVVVAAVLAGTLLPGSAVGQSSDAPTLRVSALAGVSLRQVHTGLRVAQDVLEGSARITWPRQGIQPWVHVGRFHRPGLVCFETIPCNRDGWTTLAGVTLPMARDDRQPGIHGYLLAGLGAGFSTEDTFAYLLGAGTAFTLSPVLAPRLEVRWENLPGIRNVVMLTLGLRVDLL